MQLVLSTVARRTRSTRCLLSSSCRFKSTSTNSPLRTSEGLRAAGPARTRFAPSPTGLLHLGSLRTALFNYLVAKATGGQFVLRIEDTDQKRTVEGAEQKLLEDLEWAGLEWDEGPKIGGPYGPYHQSERLSHYKKHAELLLESGHAYRCFCTPERLHTLAEHQSSLGLPPSYDRKCSHIPKEQSDDRAHQGEAHVIRLKAPERYPIYKDLVFGKVRHGDNGKDPKSPVASNEDPILLKTDGFPTYHLANVVDDHMMEITYVIRGSEWMSSTPKHLALYNAFNWQPPQFAHVGLLLDKDKQKLSKRSGSVHISEYRDKGVFPEALLNFLALHGWSYSGGDSMNLKELIENASLKYTKGDSVVTFDKLPFLQKKHALRYASEGSELSTDPRHDLNELATIPIVKRLETILESPQNQENYKTYISIHAGQAREDYIHSIILADAQNYTFPDDFITRSQSFFKPPTRQQLTEILLQTPRDQFVSTKSYLLKLHDKLISITQPNWISTTIHDEIEEFIKLTTSQTMTEANEDTLKQRSTKWTAVVYGYLRTALSASMPGPDTAVTMEILGREETVRRLVLARDVLNEVEKEILKKSSVDDKLIPG